MVADVAVSDEVMRIGARSPTSHTQVLEVGMTNKGRPGHGQKV